MKFLLFKIVSGFLLWIGIILPVSLNLGAPSQVAIVGTSTLQTNFSDGLATTTIKVATSTFAGNVSIIGTIHLYGGLNASSSATSTFQNGIQLNTGCFRDVSGSCLSSAGDGTFSTTSANWWFNGALSGTTTTGLAEGINLYYTNSRDIKFSTTSADYWVGSVLPGTTTTALPEGTNLYYTQNRWASAFAATTTTALNEGNNLYYTSERDVRFSTSSVNWWFNGALSATTTTGLAEGSNLYWTNTRFDNRLSASSSISGVTTLPNLSLPSAQVSGLFAYLFPSNATTSSLIIGGILSTASSTQIGAFDLSSASVKITKYPTLSFATSTIGTTTQKTYLGNANPPQTWNWAECRASLPTDIQFYNGSNLLNLIRATTTVSRSAFTANNVFTQSASIDLTSSSTASYQFSCTINKLETP